MASGSDTISTITIMTEVFTPPASCSRSWTYEPEAANSIENGLLVQNAAAFDNADLECFPSGFGHYGREMGDRVYSPGYCPESYTSADVAISQQTTTAICCLSSFSYTTSVMQGGKATFAGCKRMFPEQSSTVVTVRGKDAQSTQVWGPVTMWAQPITVQLQSSDLIMYVSATTTSDTPSTSATSTNSPSSTNVPSSTSSTAWTQPTAAEPTGLSTAAGIGVGVGVGVGGLAILAAIGLCFFRRRRVNRDVTSKEVPGEAAYYPAAEGNRQNYPQEMYAPPVRISPYELDDTAKPVYQQ